MSWTENNKIQIQDYPNLNIGQKHDLHMQKVWRKIPETVDWIINFAKEANWPKLSKAMDTLRKGPLKPKTEKDLEIDKFLNQITYEGYKSIRQDWIYSEMCYLGFRL